MWNRASVCVEVRDVMATSTRKPRSDAQQNRARVLSVARRSFAADGLDVTMREIARRSKLGVATVYRHFPAREDLVTAAFAEQVAACTACVAAPWPTLTRGVGSARSWTRSAVGRPWIEASTQHYWDPRQPCSRRSEGTT